MKSVILLFVLALHTSFARTALDINGPVVSVFTPLNDDRSVNYDAIYPYADYLINNGIQYFSVGVEGSEKYKMALEDVLKVMRTWVDVCSRYPSKKLGVIVHVGAAPLPRTEVVAQYADSLGVAALVVLPDLLYKPINNNGLINYVNILAAAAPHTPVLYHHNPGLTGVDNVDMPAFVKAATAAIPTFGGIWYGDNDLSRAYQCWSELELGQQLIFEANEVSFGSNAIGITCTSGVIYNLFPRMALEINNAVARGDFRTAKETNYNLARAVWAIKNNGPPGPTWLPAVKAAMEIVTGLYMGPPALPEEPIPLASKEKIRQALSNILIHAK